MADILTGKVFALDTVAQLVTTDNVYIDNIMVRFTTAAAGSFQMTSGVSQDSAIGYKICDATSVATSTANGFQLTQIFPMGGQVYKGLRKTLCVNVDTVMVVTAVPK